MQFLPAVNRILRTSGIIRGDDEDQTSFSQTQHAAALSLAQIAVQDQLASLVSENIIPLEESDAQIQYVAGQRLYPLAADFIRLQDNYLLEVDGTGASENTQIWEHPGGEKELRRQIQDYREIDGRPVWYYFTGGAVKQIGLYPVPDVSGQDARYYYESDVSVTLETDELPFHTQAEADAFTRIAARHFELLFEGVSDISAFEGDPVIIQLRATLMGMLNPRPLARRPGETWQS